MVGMVEPTLTLNVTLLSGCTLTLRKDSVIWVRCSVVTFTLVELDDAVLPVVLALPLVPAALPVVVVVEPLVPPDAVPCVAPDVPDAALFVGLLVLPEVPLVVLEAEPEVVPLCVPDAAEPEPPAAEHEPDEPPGVMMVEPPDEPPPEVLPEDDAPPEVPPVLPPEAPPEPPLA